MKRPSLFLSVAFAGATLTLPSSLHAQNDAEAFTIVMETLTEKGGKTKADESGMMTVTVAGSKRGMKIEMGDTKMQAIFDVDDRTSIMITEDKKGVKQAIKTPILNIGNKSLSDMGITYEATNETKEILGYQTRKYIMTYKDEVSETWVANVPGVDWERFAESISGGRKGSAKMMLPEFEDMPNPVALESHTEVKGGKEMRHSYVRKLLKGSSADRTILEVPAGVPMQDLTGFLRG